MWMRVLTSLRDQLKRFAVGAIEPRVVPGASPRTHEVEVRADLPVPMRDGTLLLGDLHLPIGGVAGAPTVLIRSPYGRKGVFAVMNANGLAARGIPAFMQSCRGTFGSEGRFQPQLDEQRDGVDTIRWLRAQDWFTGKLVTYGASYLGYVQWAVAGHLERTAPELAPDALCLFATMPDFGAITWDHGAFSLRNALGWSTMMATHGVRRVVRQALPDRRLQKAFDCVPLGAGDTASVGRTVDWYQDWLSHESLDDEYWTRQSHTGSVRDVTVPVTMVTGWYDIFLPWQIETYRQLADAGNPPRLTVGPWGHVSPELATASLEEALDFIDTMYLRQTDAQGAPVRIHVTGADEWRDLAEWPPPSEAVDMLFQPGGLDTHPASGMERTVYHFDPSNPTPAVGGPSLEPSSEPRDNRDHESREDVVTFTGPVLTRAIEVIGTPIATVHFRSDRPSADVFVRVCDVHPDGRSMTVCDGIRRFGSLGTKASDPIPDADGVMLVEVPLWPTAHHFGRGHRIRVQVSSGAHPRYAPNMGGTGPAAIAAVPNVARQEIFHDAVRRSGVRFPMLEAE
jgi:hypothetical protein